jgi:hypothetical protein
MAKFNRRKASETVKQFLPYTAQYSSLKFLKEYMSIRINGWKPSFKPLNVLKIVEFLHRSEKFDVLDFLLPNLVKLFEGSNESHLEVSAISSRAPRLLTIRFSSCKESSATKKIST